MVNSLKGHLASVSGNNADICSASASSMVKFEIKAFPCTGSVHGTAGRAPIRFFPSYVTTFYNQQEKKAVWRHFFFSSFDQNQMESNDFCLLKSKEDFTESSFMRNDSIEAN